MQQQPPLNPDDDENARGRSEWQDTTLHSMSTIAASYSAENIFVIVVGAFNEVSLIK